jgi:hypothetical protein
MMEEEDDAYHLLSKQKTIETDEFEPEVALSVKNDSTIAILPLNTPNFKCSVDGCEKDFVGTCHECDYLDFCNEHLEIHEVKHDTDRKSQEYDGDVLPDSKHMDDDVHSTEQTEKIKDVFIVDEQQVLYNTLMQLKIVRLLFIKFNSNKQLYVICTYDLETKKH